MSLGYEVHLLGANMQGSTLYIGKMVITLVNEWIGILISGFLF